MTTNPEIVLNIEKTGIGEIPVKKKNLDMDSGMVLKFEKKEMRSTEDSFGLEIPPIALNLSISHNNPEKKKSNKLSEYFLKFLSEVNINK